MRAFKRMLILSFACVCNIAAAQTQLSPSEDAALRVFGPRWKQFSRDAGMIFSGTVLDVRQRRLSQQAQIPIVKVKLRVERAIAGVPSRRPITIRQWTAAWTDHPMHPGQRVLLLLYPESRLGLTSPVAGALGQVTISNSNTVAPRVFVSGSQNDSQLQGPTRPESRTPITLSQLEQAIRSARGSQSSRTPRSAEEE